MELRNIQEIIDSALRSEVGTLLAKCSARQRDFFGRLYPHGLEKMTEAQLKNAFDQCQRTVRKNELDPSRLVE